MTAIQLNFTLRTNPRCKTVNLVGSWNGYQSNLPLSKDSSRDGGWKGTFRFTAPVMVPGGRYWYYYIIDGTHVSHDPARESTIEATTGRKLNILDIPAGNGSRSSGGSHHGSSKKGHSHGAKGRSLSPSQIAHPHPSRPYETHAFRGDKFSSREMEALSRRYAAQRLHDFDSSNSDSDGTGRFSDAPSFSSRSSYNSSPSSISSMGSPITPPGYSPIMPGAGYGTYPVGGHAPIGLGISGASGVCSCERYAVMRDGRRFRVDCGGKVCGNSGSECSEDSSSDDGRRSKHHHHHHSSKKSSKSHRSSHGIKGMLKGKR